MSLAWALLLTAPTLGRAAPVLLELEARVVLVDEPQLPGFGVSPGDRVRVSLSYEPTTPEGFPGEFPGAISFMAVSLPDSGLVFEFDGVGVVGLFPGDISISNGSLDEVIFTSPLRERRILGPGPFRANLTVLELTSGPFDPDLVPGVGESSLPMEFDWVPEGGNVILSLLELRFIREDTSIDVQSMHLENLRPLGVPEPTPTLLIVWLAAVLALRTHLPRSWPEW